MPQFVSTQIGKGTVLQTPTADGTTGQFLKTDGAGNLSFDTVAANPAGSDTQVQFNDGGSFGGGSNLTWDGSTFQVTGGSTVAPASVIKVPASHTDNALEIQNSTGTEKAWITAGTSPTMGIRYDSQRHITLEQTVSTGTISTGVTSLTLSPGGGSQVLVLDTTSIRLDDSTTIAGDANWASGTLVIGTNKATVINDSRNPHSLSLTAGSCFATASTYTTPGEINILAGNGGGTDGVGGDVTIAAGQGRGAGDGGSVVIQAAAAGASGSTLNALATVAEFAGGAIGFFGATPVAQPSGTGETTGFTAGSGTGVNDDSTFTGNVGSTAYRINDVVKALKNLGVLAS